MISRESLKSLSREEKLEKIRLAEERDRRLKQTKALYEPHPGQVRAHKSSSNGRYVFCGNGWGKTAFLVNEVHWQATGFNPITGENTPVPCRVIVLLDHPEKITDSFLPELTKWHTYDPSQFHKRGKPYVSQITYENGSEVIFMTHLMEPMIFESIECDYVDMDEPPPRGIFISLRRGGRKKGRVFKLLCCGTPISQSWLRTEIYDPWTKGELPGVECFRGDTEENQQNLADGYIEDFARYLSDREKSIRLKGEFFDLEGQALAHLFKRGTHIVDPFEWNRENPCVLSIDPHPNKKHVASILGCTEYGELYYLKETAQKMEPRRFAEHLKRFMDGYRIVDIVCDSLGSSEMTGGEGFKSFIEVLREERVMARATRWEEKSDEEFINRIQDVLAIPLSADNYGNVRPKLQVVSTCFGIIADIENVQWARDKKLDENKPKLEISNTDYLATLKYALATSLHYKKAKQIVHRAPVVETYGQRKSDWVRRFQKKLRRAHTK